jgi:hypothetical protein
MLGWRYTFTRKVGGWWGELVGGVCFVKMV